MLGVERDSNGWKAHALELWVESRERVADDLCVRADKWRFSDLYRRSSSRLMM